MPKGSKSGISFLDWCVNNGRNDLLERWDYEINQCDPNDVSYASQKKYYFKCPKGIHKSEENIIAIITLGEIIVQCKQCNSFYQWCINNNRKDVLNLWDYKLNDKTPVEISYCTHNKYFFKCPNGLHDSFLKRIKDIVIMGFKIDSACKGCNSFESWCINNNQRYLLDLWDYDLNKCSPKDVRRGTHAKYYFKCPEQRHKSEQYVIKAIVSGNTGVNCSYCNSFYEWGIQNNRQDILDLWDYELNDCLPTDVSRGTSNKYYFKCPDGIHSSHSNAISNITSGNLISTCLDCFLERKESFLQEKVRNYIKDNYDYMLNHEHNCTIVPINPRTGGRLRYDNEIVELKLLIEVHGKQHYEPFRGTHPWRDYSITPIKQLKQRKIIDRYKRIIAKNNGFNYLEIPFWTEKDESYKQLIDKKIEEILMKVVV